MIGQTLKKIFGTKNDRDLKKLQPLVEQINAQEPHMEKLSDDELKQQTEKFRNYLKDGKSPDDILVEAFATVREASRRVLKMRPFDVQLVGAIVLHQGKIAEMKTGEGKTLTATMPLYLNALSGKGCHLVTVNDYLASRDAKEMGELYQWLGLSVGCIVSNMEDDGRQEAYAADITYGTNNEFAWDYLRDNMKFDLGDYVQRDHHFCIVDEVDSILIDEARTPLLISGPSEGSTDLYKVSNNVVTKLSRDTHYTVDEKSKTAVLTDDGVSKVQELLNVDNLFDIKNVEMLHHVNQSLKGHTLFTLDVDYVIKEGKVVIVDEFTGRLKEGSRWSDGLHQAVEAKEGLNVVGENQTLASITFQNYFKLYDKLAGMTGTAETESEEFNTIYKLDVMVVPTNLPMVRIDNADIIYATRNGKYKAVAEHIKKLHEKNQPVLVGTISIDSSEVVSRHLKKFNVPHEVLNAKHHSSEAEIITKAGSHGSVTIATNMAGRGTDIKLTPETIKAGGLFILGTERHESRRIDNQLRGRSGRQGDPGESTFFLSLEDDLMRIFGSDRIKTIMGKLGMNDDEPIEHNMISNAIAKAQQKVESQNFDIRKHLLDFDNVMNEQRKVIYRVRRDILNNNDNMGFVREMIDDVCHYLVESYRPEKRVPLESWPWEEMKSGFQNTFHTQIDVSALDCSQKFEGEIKKYFTTTANELLDTKYSQYDQEVVDAALREILLSVFDNHWKSHLLSMDHLKEGINLRAYGQKDPLSEYKRESFDLFERMRVDVKKAVTDKIYGVTLYTKEEIEELRRVQEEQLQAQLENHRRAEEAKESRKPVTRKQAKVGRNDPCPCGSGKKFKQCHGKG